MRTLLTEHTHTDLCKLRMFSEAPTDIDASVHILL